MLMNISIFKKPSHFLIACSPVGAGKYLISTQYITIALVHGEHIIIKQQAEKSKHLTCESGLEEDEWLVNLHHITCK